VVFLVRSVEAEQIVITGIVAASIAVTFDVIPHPTSGGDGITITALTEAFSDAVSLPTLGVSSTGPVSAVSSSSAFSTTVTAHGSVDALDDASINGYEVRPPPPAPRLPPPSLG
jgi:hypothetical protein